ncbi:MAG: PGDYG domain-containing protein [Candidatus Saccharibacteria bacterium]
MSDEAPDNDIIDLDLSEEHITEALQAAPIYLKKVIVHAKAATPGEQVRTVLANGREETVNSAQLGDIIITNPGGEKYIMNLEKFTARYDALDENGNYRAKGMIRAITNPTQKNIRVMAPWGEAQNGDAACLIACPYDPVRPAVLGADRYIIGQEEFRTTYEAVAPSPGLDEESQDQAGAANQVADELLIEMPRPDLIV